MIAPASSGAKMLTKVLNKLSVMTPLEYDALYEKAMADPWYSVSVREDGNGPSTVTTLYDQRARNGALMTWQRPDRTMSTGMATVEVSR